MTEMCRYISEAVHTKAPFGMIYGLAFDPTGDLFLANGYRSVYRVDTKGILTLFAGLPPK